MNTALNRLLDVFSTWSTKRRGTAQNRLLCQRRVGCTGIETLEPRTMLSTVAATLASFNGTNGAFPEAGLVEDAGGNLFGTTGQGGAYNDGTVFEVAAGSGAITTLVSFDGTNGKDPTGLVEGSSGNLFGTTSGGGPGGCGTVFEIETGMTATLAPSAGGRGTYGGTASVAATLMAGGVPVPNETVSFSLGGTGVGTATTNSSGVATLSGVGLAGLIAGTYGGYLGASFAGDASYASSDATEDLVVSPATPTISWPTPAPITYGTALGSTQLDAAVAAVVNGQTVGVPGSFSYSLGSGTVLGAGVQTLSVTFTPADATDYTAATQTTTIHVNPATIEITSLETMSSLEASGNINYVIGAGGQLTVERQMQCWPGTGRNRLKQCAAK